MDIHKNANSQDPTADLPNGSSPRHQWYLRSSVDLPKHFDQDTTLRFVDNLSSLGLPSYYSLISNWLPAQMRVQRVVTWITFPAWVCQVTTLWTRIWAGSQLEIWNFRSA